VILLLGFILWSRNHSHKPQLAPNTCSNYAGALYDPAWPSNIADFSKESYGVIVGTVLNPQAYSGPQGVDGPTPRIRITEVLKGSAVLHKGQTIQLCAGTGIITFIDSNHTVLVFLEGVQDDIWVPHQGYIGIVPQGKDGRFKQKWGNAADTNVTAKELQNLIN